MSLLFSYLKTIYQDKKNISYIHEKSQNIYSLHACTMPLHGNALFVHFKKGRHDADTFSRRKTKNLFKFIYN